jgi:hypothetical protein
MNLTETKTRNINNKRVFKEIDDFMMDVFSTLDIYWSNSQHRDQFVEMIDMWMEQFALESGNKIIQYDIRLNQISDDQFSFILKYRQRNCYNTSAIEYIFEE